MKIKHHKNQTSQESNIRIKHKNQTSQESNIIRIKYKNQTIKH